MFKTIKDKIAHIPLDCSYPIHPILMLLYRIFSAVFYKFKKINPAIWSNSHLNKLLQNNYRSEHRVNKLAFICYSSQMFEHAENILFFLNKNEYDIIIIPNDNSVSEKALYNRVEKYQCNTLTMHEVFEKKLFYKAAIFCLYDSIPMGFAYKNRKIIWGAELIAEKLVRIVSTIHASKLQFSKNRNLLYDYIICMGNFHKQRYETLGLKAKLYVLGSPRFDKIYKDVALEKELSSKLNLDDTKKTILWLPTHYQISSLFNFLPMIAKIKDKFNIVIKPHPTLYLEVDNLDTLIASLLPEAIVLKNIDNVKLFPFADFVICDYGGSFFTALKADKNILFFNSRRMDILKFRLGLDSPEILIRDRIINFDYKDVEIFLTAIEDKQIWQEQTEIRRSICEEFFYDNPNAAQDMANLFRRILNNEEQ